MERKFFFLCAVMLVIAVSARAADPGLAETGATISKHKEYNPDVPRHEIEGAFFFGYRWLDREDSERAGEYENPDSSAYGKLDIATYPLPHRFHLNVESRGRDNLYGDVGYAYQDLVLFRDVFTDIYHNLDHYDYQYGGEPPTVKYNDRNTAARYHISSSDNFLTLRLKVPDFPFHTYLKQRHIEKNGAVQQRSLIGYFGDITKLSQTRDIDWQSDELILGTNSHLGPVEVDYSYGYTRFDPGANNVLYDAYPLSLARPADTYPHDVNPGIESWANTLKLHTSYTGRIVASAALGNLRRENTYSDAEAELWHGATDFKWMPSTALGLYFKYRHRNLDMENPGSVTLKGLANTNTYAVRRSISSKKDILSLTANYRPIKKITLVSAYEFEHTARKDTDEWFVLPGSTDSNNIRLAAYGRPRNNLKLTFAYQYTNLNNPSINTEPDSSNRLQFSTTYLPCPWITVLVDYNRISSERDHVRYRNVNPDALVDGGSREDRDDSILGSLSFLVSPKVTLTTSLAYQRNRAEQGLAYGKFLGAAGDLPYLDPGVDYRDEANFYSLGIQYLPTDDIILSADVSRTDTEGDFLPRIAIAGTPASVASFSTIRVTETILALEMIRKIRKNWEVGLRFYTNDYNDKIDNRLDGRLYTSIISLKRQF